MLMSEPDYKLLKLSTGDTIICMIQPECNIFTNESVFVINPIVVDVMKVPAEDGFYETCIMYAWNSFSSDEACEIATMHILACTNPTANIKEYYLKYLENSKNVDDVLMEDLDAEPNTYSSVEDKIQEEYENFLDNYESNEHDELTPESNSGDNPNAPRKRIYH
jgi:hypothetical protein